MRLHAIVLASVAGFSTTARAESFPLDLFTVQPVALEPGGEIVLQGALHSRHDGAVLDGLTTTIADRSVSGGLLDAEAGGLRVVWRDPEQHRYRAIATGGAGPACQAASLPSPCLVPRTLELAQARLLTVADFAQSLSGEVMVERPGSGGMGWRLAELAHAPWQYQLAATGPLVALGGRVWLRHRRRRGLAPVKSIARLAAGLRRRLRQGDPVHQRLLAPLGLLVDRARRLEGERRRGLVEGWPAEAERAANGLQAIMKSLHDMSRSLDEATRLGRGALDDRLLSDLHDDLHLALDACAEGEAVLARPRGRSATQSVAS